MKNYIFTIFAILFFAFAIFGQIKGFVTTENANLRKLPNSESDVIAVIPENAEIIVKSKKHLNGWYEVQFKKNRGWLHGNTFSFSKDDSEKKLKSAISENKEAENGWFKITSTKESATGLIYYYRIKDIKRPFNNQVSTWIKAIPYNSVAFSRKNKIKSIISYILQFVTVDCEDERISFENTTLYDSDGSVIPISSFASNSYRDPVIPNSVGEGILVELCEYK